MYVEHTQGSASPSVKGARLQLTPGGTRCSSRHGFLAPLCEYSKTARVKLGIKTQMEYQHKCLFGMQIKHSDSHMQMLCYFPPMTLKNKRRNYNLFKFINPLMFLARL